MERLIILDTSEIVRVTRHNRQIWDDLIEPIDRDDFRRLSPEIRDPFPDVDPNRWGSLIVCADYENGDRCAYDADDHHDNPVLDAFHEAGPGDWRQDYIIAPTFETFVRRMLDAIVKGTNGPVYWLG